VKPLTLISLLALCTLLLLCRSASAADKDELRQRAEKRYPELQSLKAAGIIGETSEGFVEIVDGKDAPAEARKLVDEENADRRQLYAILARESSTTPDRVAAQAARRNFERADAGEYLKENGKWRRKGA